MGIWREHFHPSVWLRWEVLGWILATVIAIAGLLLFFDQYAGANVCFGLTAFFVFAKIIHVGATTNEALSNRLLFTFVLFGLVGIGIAETIRGVNHWAEKKQKQQTGTSDSSRTHDAALPAPKPPEPLPHEAEEANANVPKDGSPSGTGSQPPLGKSSPPAGKLGGPKPQPTKLQDAPLKARESTKPTEDQAFHEKVPEMVYFSLGEHGMTMGNSIESLTEEKSTLMNMGGFVPVKFHLEKGVIYCDVTIWGGPTGPPIQLVHNEFTVQPPNWDRNFSDNALEVVDDRAEPIFQLIRKTPSHYVMNGLMPIPGGGFILATPNEARGMPPSATMPPGTLKPIFRYPSWKYPGQYAE